MSEHKTVVVTGASRGLGRALVEELVKRDLTVIGCARNTEAMADLASLHPDHQFSTVDVADQDSVMEWAGRVLEQFGPPDLLLNNAAVMPAPVPLWEVPPEEFHQVVQVNIVGVYYMIRAFVPAMIDKGTGIVVNFSSPWGRSVARDVAAYCATKWAIEGMTRAMAAELPGTMAAIPFNPGIIKTDMLDSVLGATSKLYPTPDKWSEAATQFLLDLEPGQSGQPLTAPRV